MTSLENMGQKPEPLIKIRNPFNSTRAERFWFTRDWEKFEYTRHENCPLLSVLDPRITSISTATR